MDLHPSVPGKSMPLLALLGDRVTTLPQEKN
jgi:hypothetical protein